MRFKSIEIENYRNLDGIKVHFNLESNYIVGENNIGKSNFLALLNTISNTLSNARSFSEKDFTDLTRQIVINLSLKLNETEYGVFGDSFSPTDSSLINIRIVQDIREAHPQVTNADTTETIRSMNLKKINFLKYDTNVNPINELRFDKSKGVGAFLGHMIRKYITPEDTFLNQDSMDKLVSHLNLYLKKIKSFDEFGISANVTPDSADVLSKLVYLMDGNQLPISNTGNGIQFIALAALNIFSRILDLYKSKSIPFEESLFTTREEKKILPLVLAIDEPEVHLHPYMQRAMLNYYKHILKNEDENFLELLKYSFNIDGLDGQLIVVTHSTDALVDNYRNIVRFYKARDKRTNAISGTDINIKPGVEKHLIMNFQDIKEAFYSKCVLIVEGETEYGCIPGFAKTLNIPMDDFGICVVNAQGEGSIPKLQQLFNHFDIPSVVIFDSDVKEGKTASENEFFTKEICFEMDIVAKLIEMEKFDILKSIALELDNDANEHILDADFVKKPFSKIGYDLTTYTPKSLENLKIDQINEYRAVYFAWYYNKKGILIGRIIGNILPADCIPTCYINAINKAKEVALL